MASTAYRGELLLTQEEANSFNKTVENVCFDIYGIAPKFVPWRISPIDQTIRTHTPTSISLATVLRELDATIDPADIIKQPLNRRSSYKHETATLPPSPTPTPPPVEVKEEPKRKILSFEEKVEYDSGSEFYALLHPPEGKFANSPEWVEKMHKIISKLCYQSSIKPFIKYFRDKRREKMDDLDFDDLSDDLHDILMDIDEGSKRTENDVKKELSNQVDNYIKIDTNHHSHNNVDTSNSNHSNSHGESNTVSDTVKADATEDNSVNIDEQLNNTENLDTVNPNNEVKLGDKVEVDKVDKQGEIEEVVDMDYLLENLHLNKFENCSRVFSLLYSFLVKQFKAFSPGSHEWMCAQDLSAKLHDFKAESGLTDAEKLHSFPDEMEIQPILPVLPEPQPPVEVKKPRNSMEDFEHEIALINKSDDYTSTISLPEVKNITDEERMEFYENVMMLSQECQLELFTVFEHAAVWKIVGNGEIELDDQITDPKIYRGMIKWVKEKKNSINEKEIELITKSEIVV